MSDPSHRSLTEAIVSNDLAKVKKIVASEGLLSGSYALLVRAVQLCRNDIVKFLIEKGAQVTIDKYKIDKLPLLHIAVQKEHRDIAEMLLKAGCPVNGKFKGKTAVCNLFDIERPKARKSIGGIVPRNGVFQNEPIGFRFDIFQLLVANGADLKQVAYPLHRAAEREDIQLCKHLIENGIAGVNDVESRSKETPLFYSVASRTGKKEICRYLLQNGADPNAKGKFGETPLHHAVRLVPKKDGVLHALLEFGADPNAKRSDGETPLFGASASCMGTVQALLDHGADIHVKNRNGETPLFRASKETIQAFLDRGADTHVKNRKGETPLFSASCMGTVQALLDHGADIHVKNRNGETPLHHAAAGVGDEVEILLKNGAEVDVPRKKDGATPLHLAAGTENMKVVKLLLEFHANIEAEDAEGHTPLHWALSDRWGREVVLVLLEHNCNVNILDNYGQAALRVLKDNWYYSIDNVRNTVLEHLSKLKFAKQFLNKENERLIGELRPNYAGDYEEFEQKCRDELEKMKELKLCCHLSLYDALVDSSNPAFATNDSVVRNLESVKFHKFPVYGKMIESMAKENRFISASKNSLNFLIKTRRALHQEKFLNVPEELLLIIVSYLDRNDLRCLTKCCDALKHQLSKLAEKRKTNATISSKTRSCRKNIKKI